MLSSTRHSKIDSQLVDDKGCSLYWMQCKRLHHKKPGNIDARCFAHSLHILIRWKLQGFCGGFWVIIGSSFHWYIIIVSCWQVRILVDVVSVSDCQYVVNTPCKLVSRLDCCDCTLIAHFPVMKSEVSDAWCALGQTSYTTDIEPIPSRDRD